MESILYLDRPNSSSLNSAAIGYFFLPLISLVYIKYCWLANYSKILEFINMIKVTKGIIKKKVTKGLWKLKLQRVNKFKY